jgi:hypothetical protein
VYLTLREDLIQYREERSQNMTTMARTKEYTLLFCPERWCGSGAWLVRRDTHVQGLWEMTHPVQGGTCTVAATDPVCPRCGATLTTIMELDGGLGLGNVFQSSGLLDGIRLF